MVLKYINNQQFLSLKELSLFPDKAKVVIPSSSLPSTRTGYAAAPFKCFLYSPQQSPSIHSPYPPLLFLFFLLFITVTVCILNLRLALAAFFFLIIFTLLFSIPSLNGVLIVLSLWWLCWFIWSSLAFTRWELHLSLEGTPWGGLPFANMKCRMRTATTWDLAELSLTGASWRWQPFWIK